MEKPATEQEQSSAHQKEREREERVAKIAKRRRSIRRRSYIKPIIESVAGLATVGILLFTIVYSHYAGIQAGTAKEMVITTQKNAVASERPWIGPIQENIDPLVGGQKPNLVMMLNNFGHSPALEVETKMSGGAAAVTWAGVPVKVVGC